MKGIYSIFVLALLLASSAFGGGNFVPAAGGSIVTNLAVDNSLTYSAGVLGIKPGASPILNGANVTNLSVKSLGGFTVAFIPDPQMMMEAGNATRWNQLCNWVATNTTIDAVVCLGDNVNQYNVSSQWTTLLAGYAALAGKPHLVGVGNHDADNQATRDYTTFNTKFPASYYTAKSWWGGGFFEAGKQQNLYVTVTNGAGAKALLISLQVFPTAAQVAWAKTICQTFPDHIALLATHSYLMPDGTRSRPGDQYTAALYGANDGLDGNAMWSMLKDSPSLVAIASGHQITYPQREAHNVMIGTNGNWVNQIFADWQEVSDGGGYVGYVKVCSFSPNGRGYARTFDAGNLVWLPAYDYPLAAGMGATLKPLTVADGVTVRTQTNRDDTISLSSGGTSALEQGLIFYAPFNEGAGSLAQDFSKYGQLNDSYGGALKWWTPPSAGMFGCAWIPATNVMVYSNNAPWLTVSNQITVSCWFYTTNVAGGAGTHEEVMVGRHMGGTSGDFYMGRRFSSHGLSYVMIAGGVRIDGFSDTTVSASNWHHMAMTYNGAWMGGYFDGVLVYSNALTGNLLSMDYPLTVGNYLPSGTGYPCADTSLDEVKIWNRCLSGEEIWQLSLPLRAGALNISNVSAQSLTVSNVNAKTLSYPGHIYLLASKNTASGVTNSNAETQIFSCPVTGGAIPSNGVVRVTMLCSGSVTNIGDVYVYYGATRVSNGYSTHTSGSYNPPWQILPQFTIANRNALNRQVGTYLQAATTGHPAAAPVISSFDTSTNFTLSVAIQSRSGAAFTNWAEFVTVELLSRD